MATKARKTPAQRRASDVASGRLVRGFWRSPTGANHGRDSRPGDVWCEPGDITDTDRLNWLEKQHLTLAAVKERWSEEIVLWWQVVDGKRSLSGHPLASPREAIDAAMLSANVPDQPRGKPAQQAEVTPARVGL